MSAAGVSSWCQQLVSAAGVSSWCQQLVSAAGVGVTQVVCVAAATAGVFHVLTVVHAPLRMRALRQTRFAARTRHIVEPDDATTLATFNMNAVPITHIKTRKTVVAPVIFMRCGVQGLLDKF